MVPARSCFSLASGHRRSIALERSPIDEGNCEHSAAGYWVGLHSTSFYVFDCDEHIERKLLAFATHTRSRQGEELEVIYRYVSDGTEKNVLAIVFHGHFLEVEVCKRNVRSSSRLHSRFSRSEASFFFCCFSSSPPGNWWLHRQ